MEEVPGIPGHIPPLAAYPAASVRHSLPPAEWDACLDSWLVSIEVRLRLQDSYFSQFKLSQNASGTPFLVSLLTSTREEGPAASKPQKERLLMKRAYMLLRRLLLVTKVPLDYDHAELLELLCLASLHYASVADWRTTVKTLWKRDHAQMASAVESWKKTVISRLSSQPASEWLLDQYRRLNAYVKVSPDAGLALMTGSDYLESLMEAYSSTSLQSTADSADSQKLLTEHLFYCLRSLMSDGLPHGSLLLDHLYYIKSEADRATKSNSTQPTLCSSLVCTTSFLRHLAADDTVNSGKRGQSLIEALTTYRQNTAQLHPLVGPRKRKVAKGKGKADVQAEIHVHRASQISQVHDLFPDFSSNYIHRLLDHFGDDVEAVIAALLEPETLPPHLRDPGPSDEPLPDIDGPHHDLAPRSTPPMLPQRKSVFDGDDFDNLRISSGRLHKGRKDLTIDKDGTPDESARRKAAIMAALAAFDSDDDERDDTYDVADVGGTVDSTIDTDSRPRPETGPAQNPYEETLYRAWKDNEELFARDSKTRISRVRQDLKRETGMSDEQIEGWAIMLKKDPKRQDQLEKKFSASHAYRGNQAALGATRWQAGTPEESEEGEDRPASRAGQGRGRGNHSSGRGRGGSAAGPSGDAATQAARKRKEQGRGRGGANHNRREGRARKMGRGMTGPAG
ncbi:hypothetical protein A1O1_03080 [Capronia coronata CBS 617.96]|uniref:CUE domain-containing protein n=1 Tax=Capronia coronata CBS 617.96 TaxID=1182541 RepID=W9YQ38_9EURO|nr:uncharacterized protein A1O1_03080 [Capronia coronata CBS 617.96]EXJ94683.1 hypothetical protein A1O1_03080 [Capronia coronata CBS 617.96]